MTDFPSLSIVTPTLNQARFIRGTLDSVLGQRYPNLEYLVVDGGSSDGTQEILASYEDRIRWYVEQGVNQSRAINIGWRETSGKVIAWINSDDYYQPGVFQAVGEYFKQHPDVDMLYGDCDYVGIDGEFLRPYPTREYDFLKLLGDTENFIPQPAVFLRRSVLDRTGYLDESLDYVQDFDFWLRVGLGHQVAYVPQKFASLRLHPAAKSVASLSSFADELVSVYSKFFSDDQLPKEVRDLKKDAMANIYNRAADCAFWGKDYPSARRYAKTSRSYRTWPLRGSWFWIALGRLGNLLAERIYSNPYFY